METNGSEKQSAGMYSIRIAWMNGASPILTVRSAENLSSITVFENRVNSAELFLKVKTKVYFVLVYYEL
jgi:hypothetical protein